MAQSRTEPTSAAPDPAGPRHGPQPPRRPREATAPSPGHQVPPGEAPIGPPPTPGSDLPPTSPSGPGGAPPSIV